MDFLLAYGVVSPGRTHRAALALAGTFLGGAVAALAEATLRSPSVAIMMGVLAVVAGLSTLWSP